MPTRLQSVLSVLVLMLLVGCDIYDKHMEGLPDTAVLKVTTRSSSSAEVSDMHLWAYACDADGNVAIDASETYISASGNSATMQLMDPESRYYLLAGVLNAEADGNSFSSLSSATFTTLDEHVASHWMVVDLMSEGTASDGISVSMDMFRTVGKLNLSIAKTSELMRLLLTDVSVCSVSAPTEGLLFSKMSSEQICNGGKGVSQWWFGESVPNRAEYSESIIGQSIELSQTGSYSTIGSALLHENQYGWTDLSAFEEAGYSLCPAESDPDFGGYYLSLEYRYSFMPDISLSEESDLVTIVRKYIPLSPVCRGNEYEIKVAINKNDIVVVGSTEVSEEVNGVW